MKLDMPPVLEEFGLARDDEPIGDIYDPESSVSRPQSPLKAMYGAVYKSAVSGSPMAGDNLWHGLGEVRPGNGWTGDPPHETPGWYSVYDTDASTLAIIAAHAEEMAALE